MPEQFEAHPDPVRVFLVEDSPKLRDEIVNLLHSLGVFAIVGSAATEAEANLWADEHTGEWDLAILDLVLEQGTGMGVIARFRSGSDDGTIVVFSDYVSPGIQKHCLDLGADAAIPKIELQTFIDRCLHVARERGQAL